MKKDITAEMKIMKNKDKKRLKKSSSVNLLGLILMKKTLTFLKSTTRYLDTLKNHTKNCLKN